jgi:CheY-like chemotaxis protein
MASKKKVLLVNDNPVEREELSGHLSQAGYVLDHAKDGAPAINKAISGQPDAIITVADMPLVDGFKLCQLLRTNPVTRLIPFIFITDKETNPRKLGEFINPADDFILRPFKTDELLGRLNNLFYRVDKVQEVSSEEDRTVAGTLTEIALVDLLQIFKMNRKNGTLNLKRERETGRIFIREGSVINARIGGVDGEKAIMRMISWQDGTFDFKPGPTPAETKIHQPTENLIMEGLRQFDELNRLKDQLLPKETSLILKKRFKGPESKLRPVTREVLKLLEYFNVVGDILDNSMFADLEIYRTMNALLDQGIIEVRDKDAPGAPRPDERILSLEEALKIGYHMGVGQEEPTQQWKGKIFVFSSDPALFRGFLERAGAITEFHRESHSESSGKKRALSPGIKGSISIMDKASLMLMEMPPGQGFEPLWQAFRNGTIGALLMGTGGKKDDPFFEHAADFLKTRSIPFAAVRLLTGTGDGSKQTGAIGTTWHPVKVSSKDFPRRVLRHLFEAILAS